MRKFLKAIATDKLRNVKLHNEDLNIEICNSAKVHVFETVDIVNRYDLALSFYDLNEDTFNNIKKLLHQKTKLSFIGETNESLKNTQEIRIFQINESRPSDDCFDVKINCHSVD